MQTNNTQEQSPQTMKQVIHESNGSKAILQEVHGKPFNIQCVGSFDDGLHFSYSYWEGFKVRWGSFIIPHGNWVLKGLASSLTTEQKEVLVERYRDVFVDYSDCFSFCNTADESFFSLLTSHSLPPETTIILKQVKQ